MKIPADPENMNDGRADWAQEAIITFQLSTGLRKEDGTDTAVTDLIADLAHYCDRQGHNLGKLIKKAAFHYEEETTGKKGKCGQQFKEVV